MQNKNKIQFGEIGENRLVYFAAEMPTLSEGEVASVKKHKEENAPELDTKDLVDKANGVIGKYRAQIEELPPALKNVLHDEIVKYFLVSPERFAGDKEKGLSEQEFAAYRAAMIGKVESLMKEYAPSEEDVMKMHEARAKAGETMRAAEKLQPIDVKDVAESPGNIESLTQLDSAFKNYENWNESLQQEAINSLNLGEEVQKSYAGFKKERDGILAYKKFSSYWLGAEDKEKIALKRAVDSAKQRLGETVKKYESAKIKLVKYGDQLRQVSNYLKEKQLAERDSKIAEIDAKSDEATEEKIKKDQQFDALEKRQMDLQKEKEGLVLYAKQAAQGKDFAENQKKTAEMKRGELGKCQSGMRSAANQIDNALKNNSLSDEEREQLEATKKQILEKLGEVSLGVKAAETIMEGQKLKTDDYTEMEKAAVRKSFKIESHLEEQVNPAIGSLDNSIAVLEGAKMKFATTKDQINDHYERVFANYNRMDDAVDGAVLKVNIANERAISALVEKRNALGAIDLGEPKGVLGKIGAFIESTPIGFIPSSIGGGISFMGEKIMDQSKWLYDTLDKNKDNMGAVGYDFAWLGVQIVGFPVGVAGGLIEMAGGVVSMVGSPIETVKGLSSLIGRDAVTGKWSPSAAGEAWKNMGKAIIAFEDFEKGRLGIGAGKFFVNFATTFTGAGAVSSGGKAAGVAYTAARAAEQGVVVAIGKAGIAGGKAAAVFVGKEITGDAVGAVQKIKAAPGKILDTGKAVVGKVTGKLKGGKPVEKVADLAEEAAQPLEAAAQPAVAEGLTTDVDKSPKVVENASPAAIDGATDIGHADTIFSGDDIPAKLVEEVEESGHIARVAEEVVEGEVGLGKQAVVAEDAALTEANLAENAVVAEEAVLAEGNAAKGAIDADVGDAPRDAIVTPRTDHRQEQPTIAEGSLGNQNRLAKKTRETGTVLDDDAEFSRRIRTGNADAIDEFLQRHPEKRESLITTLDLETTQIRIDVLKRIEDIGVSPEKKSELIKKLSDTTPEQLAAVNRYGVDYESINGILDYPHKDILRLFARDEHRVLQQFVERGIYDPISIRVIFTPEIVSFLENKLDSLEDAKETIVMGEREIYFYADRTVPIGVGGINSFSRILIIDPITGEIKFAGIKEVLEEAKAKGVSGIDEANGASKINELVKNEMQSHPEVADYFVRPLAVSDDAIVYEIVDRIDADGVKRFHNANDALYDEAVSAESMLGMAYQMGEAVSVMHARGLIHGDLKFSQGFIGQERVKLGDFGTITSFEDFSGVFNNDRGVRPLPSTGELFYMGKSAIAVSPQYHSGPVVDRILEKGPQFAWKYDAYAFGTMLEEIADGKITLPAAKETPSGFVHDPSRVVTYESEIPKRTFADSKAQDAVREIVRKLKNPDDLSYTVADALRDLKPLLGQ